jgi:hypothetical protein
MPLHILLCDGVLLYFILRIEVIRNLNLIYLVNTEKNWKYKWIIYFPGLLGRNPAGPAEPLLFFPYRVAQPALAWPIITAQWPAPAHAILVSDRESSPPKEFFPTVFFTRFLRILTESKFNPRLEIDTTSTSCALWLGTKSPIKGAYTSLEFAHSSLKPKPPS